MKGVQVLPLESLKVASCHYPHSCSRKGGGDAWEVSFCDGHCLGKDALLSLIIYRALLRGFPRILK